jgi:hypothetical protein
MRRMPVSALDLTIIRARSETAAAMLKRLISSFKTRRLVSRHTR